MDTGDCGDIRDIFRRLLVGPPFACPLSPEGLAAYNSTAYPGTGGRVPRCPRCPQ